MDLGEPSTWAGTFLSSTRGSPRPDARRPVTYMLRTSVIQAAHIPVSQTALNSLLLPPSLEFLVPAPLPFVVPKERLLMNFSVADPAPATV